MGAPEGIRTPNLLIRSQMLYPLSYGRVAEWPRQLYKTAVEAFESAMLPEAAKRTLVTWAHRMARWRAQRKPLGTLSHLLDCSFSGHEALPCGKFHGGDYRDERQPRTAFLKTATPTWSSRPGRRDHLKGIAPLMTAEALDAPTTHGRLLDWVAEIARAHPARSGRVVRRIGRRVGSADEPARRVRGADPARRVEEGELFLGAHGPERRRAGRGPHLHLLARRG